MNCNLYAQPTQPGETAPVSNTIGGKLGPRAGLGPLNIKRKIYYLFVPKNSYIIIIIIIIIGF